MCTNLSLMITISQTSEISVESILTNLKRNVECKTVTHTAGKRELLTFSLIVGRSSDMFLFPWLPDSFP